MGRKDLITRFMSLGRSDMSGRIMNQEQGIAKEKVWVRTRGVMSAKNPAEVIADFQVQFDLAC
jgi:hypothetical protein